MRNLIHINEVHFDRFTNVVNSKYNPRKTRLLALSNHVRNRYLDYQTHFNNLTLDQINIHPLTDQDCEDLSDCYSLDLALLGDLIVSIRENQPKELRSVCQYCGIGKPGQIDHYLPQSGFPEFAVLALNMLPCCGDCNQKKLHYWRDNNGVRGIINFYIDTLPNTQFLFANIMYDPTDDIPTVTFNLDIPNTIDPTLAQIVSNHFNRLGLLDRYRELSDTVISNTIQTIESYLNSTDINEIRIRIQREASKTAAKLGINHWRSVLMATLALNNRFIDYLRDRIINN